MDELILRQLNKIPTKTEFISFMQKTFIDCASEGERISSSDFQLILGRAAELKCKTEVKRLYATAKIPYTDAPNWITVNQAGLERVSPERLSNEIENGYKYFFVQSARSEEGRLFWYENGVYKLISKSKAKSIIKDIIGRYNPDLATIKAIDDTYKHLTYTHSLIHTVSDDNELNSDYNLINFKNGFLNLDTMQMQPHDDEIKSTIQIPCDWTGSADTPTPVFDKYIDHLAGGEPEAKQTLLEVIGLAISNIPVYKYKTALFIIGDGNSGKTQFPNLITRLIGAENSVAMPFCKLEDRFQIVNLYQKRLAVDDDCRKANGAETRTFKSMTAAGQLDGEPKGKESFTFTYNGLYIVLANEIPRFGGDHGDHVYERILPIKCGASIPKSGQDKNLLEKMYQEREGIIYKAIQALKPTIDNNYQLTEGETSKKLRAKYMIENDSVFKFLDECCKTYGSCKDAYSTARLYDAYKQWCNICGEYCQKRSEFKQKIAQKLHIPEDKVTQPYNGKYYYPYTLKASAIEEYHL